MRFSLPARGFCIVAGVLVAESGNLAKGQTASAAAKPTIEISTFGKWPTIGDWGGGGELNSDGSYASYVIENQPAGKRTSVIAATHGDWRLEIPEAGFVLFTHDGHQAIVTKPGDTLMLVTLGGSTTETIPHASSVALHKGPDGEWLIYQTSAPIKGLVFRNMGTGKTKSFPSVRDYFVSDDGRCAILHSTYGDDSAAAHSIQWVSLVSDSTVRIWQGRKVSSVIADSTLGRVAFLVDDSSGDRTGASIWSDVVGTDTAVQLFPSGVAGIDSGLAVSHLQRFSRDGGRLFISLKSIEHPLPAKHADFVSVDVWSYTDERLQGDQLDILSHGRPPSPDYRAVIDLDHPHVYRLEFDHEQVDDRAGDVALVHHSVGDAFDDEWNWNIALHQSLYLESLTDGTRKPILADRHLDYTSSLHASLSPNGKYIIFYDPKQKNYFSYTIATGAVHNITGGITTTWTSPDDDNPDAIYNVAGPAGWIRGDSALFLSDHYDMWQVDPAGRAAPINLTNGYGRRHHIAFRFCDWTNVVPNHTSLAMNAMNDDTKESGFYRTVVGQSGDPLVLTMGPYKFGWNFTKASSDSVYLVRRETASESANLFVTRDWKTFTPITDIHPERDYNWLTTELVTWKTLDGSQSQGVLYKPENFDPTHKYPVILYYYETFSYRLHEYLKPEALQGSINIPYFVSHGYVVFTPDIHYKEGKAGASALNSIVSAAQYLAAQPWVDAKHMGIQGHSFGGFETDYVITHSHLFAAAMSAAGIVDATGFYGGLWGWAKSTTGWAENRQGRFATTPWNNPEVYTENSPIFRANQVTTPLLMMNNKKDGNVPFAQGVAFFTALRRLGKPVWMLQYDDGDHGLEGKPAEDLALRFVQFFDFYLKGAPPPKWMVEGVPATLKGIDQRLDLEPAGTPLRPGLLDTTEVHTAN